MNRYEIQGQKLIAERNARKAKTREALGTDGLARAAQAREDARHAALRAKRLARVEVAA